MNAHVKLPFLLPLLLLGAGCTAEKSSNPLTPTVAGPIPGVTITAPSNAEPGSGSRVAVDRQPITLVVGNAVSNGPRPLNYLFEIATDVEFTNKVFGREGIEPGDGRTSLRLPDPLTTGRTYYWRSRAQDGANTGPYSSTTNFAVFTPIVIDRPGPLAPTNNQVLTTQRPTFTFTNAPRSGPVGAIFYELEVSESYAFDSKFANWAVAEQPNQTSTQLPLDGPYGKYFFWHVRAYDTSTIGPWTGPMAFSMPQAPSPPPGGGGGTPGKPCGPPYPNTGESVIACVSSQYPDKLVAGVSLDQRRANMAFLRDRVIETGICGGMDLGWNRKGNGEITLDGLAWVTGGQPYFVDIGYAYDDTSRPLQLMWGKGDITGGYVPYSPRPSCK
jgi:hypothetical protein